MDIYNGDTRKLRDVVERTSCRSPKCLNLGHRTCHTLLTIHPTKLTQIGSVITIGKSGSETRDCSVRKQKYPWECVFDTIEHVSARSRNNNHCFCPEACNPQASPEAWEIISFYYDLTRFFVDCKITIELVKLIKRMFNVTNATLCALMVDDGRSLCVFYKLLNKLQTYVSYSRKCEFTRYYISCSLRFAHLRSTSSKLTTVTTGRIRPCMRT